MLLPLPLPLLLLLLPHHERKERKRKKGIGNWIPLEAQWIVCTYSGGRVSGGRAR
jgi:hypothetical protein